MKLSAEHISL